jgi:glycosyltransferase involved in cell wall biosynthesis
MHPLRLALLPDFREEGWPSMDLCADMLAQGLQRDHASRFAVALLRPRYHRRLERLTPRARNVDRLLNRFRDYPRHLRRLRPSFDLFHVADHSYAQLLHELPPDRTGVYCHDLDTFNCLLNPRAEQRPKWFRAMARRILNGFEKSALIFHSTDAIRDQILQYQLADPAKLVQAPLGVSEVFCAIPPEQVQSPASGDRYILHVGSGIPRKRLDVLLNVFAAVRPHHPGLRLIQVGGPWTDAQLQLIQRHHLENAIIQRRNLQTWEIADLYRRAAVVLQTSEAEGFGLPVIEALACGAPVLASDISTLREVGGPAASYAPVADIDAWAKSLSRLLDDPAAAPTLQQRLRQASRYSWANHCQIIADAYERLAQ